MKHFILATIITAITSQITIIRPDETTGVIESNPGCYGIYPTIKQVKGAKGLKLEFYNDWNCQGRKVEESSGDKVFNSPVHAVSIKVSKASRFRNLRAYYGTFEEDEDNDIEWGEDNIDNEENDAEWEENIEKDENNDVKLDGDIIDDKNNIDDIDIGEPLNIDLSDEDYSNLQQNSQHQYSKNVNWESGPKGLIHPGCNPAKGVYHAC